MRQILNILLVFLATACSGAEFAAGDLAELDGALEEADGGVTSPVTGGTGGVTQGTGGAGGGAAGTGGRASGGQATTDGAPSAGGQTSGGGTADAGGTAEADAGVPVPACEPPQITEANLLTHWVWESYESRHGDQCLRCEAGAPCSTCEISWWPITQEGTRVTATANKVDCGAAALVVEACATSGTAACTSIGVYGGFTISFDLVPTADGWAVADVDWHTADGITMMTTDYLGNCGSTVANQATFHQARAVLSPTTASSRAIQAALTAQTWPCSVP